MLIKKREINKEDKCPNEKKRAKEKKEEIVSNQGSPRIFKFKREVCIFKEQK